MAAMRELYASGDAEAALVVASAIQPKADVATPPTPPEWTVATADHTVEPQTLATRKSVPRLKMPRAQVAKTPLDPRARALLKHVDGSTNLSAVIDASGLAHDEAMKLVDRLVALNVITFD